MVGTWEGRQESQEGGTQGVWGGSQAWSRAAAPQTHWHSPTAALSSQGDAGQPSLPAPQPYIPLLQRSDPASHTPSISIFPLCRYAVNVSSNSLLNTGSMGAKIQPRPVKLYHGQLRKTTPSLSQPRQGPLEDTQCKFYVYWARFLGFMSEMGFPLLLWSSAQEIQMPLLPKIIYGHFQNPWINKINSAAEYEFSGIHLSIVSWHPSWSSMALWSARHPLAVPQWCLSTAR